MTAAWRDFEDEEAETDWVGAVQEPRPERYPVEELVLVLGVIGMVVVLLLLAGGWPG